MVRVVFLRAASRATAKPLLLQQPIIPALNLRKVSRHYHATAGLVYERMAAIAVEAPKLGRHHRSGGYRDVAYYHQSMFSTTTTTQQQTRSFASKKKSSKDDKQGPLSNERLVAAIMSNFPTSKPDGVQVRLVVEEMVEGERKTTTDVVPLSVAIQTAVDKELDLIDVAIQQEIPVIKAANLSSILYREKKKQSSSKTALAVKEFTFKVAIGDADLVRQVDRMKTFIEKGHSCLIRCRCPGWMAAKDERAIHNFLDKLMELLEETAEPISKIDIDELNTHAKLTVAKKRTSK
ncbi:hypothetical protein ACA910_016936 [Epithemia clementina (nom. ined.)]